MMTFNTRLSRIVNNRKHSITAKTLRVPNKPIRFAATKPAAQAAISINEWQSCHLHIQVPQWRYDSDRSQRRVFKHFPDAFQSYCNHKLGCPCQRSTKLGQNHPKDKTVTEMGQRKRIKEMLRGVRGCGAKNERIPSATLTPKGSVQRQQQRDRECAQGSAPPCRLLCDWIQ